MVASIQSDFYVDAMLGLRELVTQLGIDLLITTDDVLRYGCDGGAIFDASDRYRYVLWRIWDASLPLGAFIGLNPSTADHEKSDPTCTREMRFLRNWNYGGYLKVNMYGYRATKPKDMLKQSDPIGPNNDAYVMRVLSRVQIAIAAWGSNVPAWREARFLTKWANEPSAISELRALKLTGAGSPGHPLYLPANSTPFTYRTKADPHADGAALQA